MEWNEWPRVRQFPGGHPTLTPDGLMAIESLKVGDIVVSRLMLHLSPSLRE